MENNNFMLERLKELLFIHTPSGHEDGMIKYFFSEAKKLGITPEIDMLGNVKIRMGKANGKPRLMIFAHMDEVGLIVRKIDENGYLWVEKIGGIPEGVLVGKKVEIKTVNDVYIEGVIGNKAHHYTLANEKYSIVPIERIYVDVGCCSRIEVLKLGVEVGSVMTYAKDFFQRGSKIFAPSIDNKIGCFVILSLMKELAKKELFSEVFLVGSVQEEFNLRGILPAARSINPDFAISLDVAVSCDTPDLDKTDIGLGGGPVINSYSFHGRGTLGGVIPNQKLKKIIKDSARKSSIVTQDNVFYGGLTDASFLLLENNGIPSIELGIPVRYTHSTFEACDTRDVENLIRLLINFIISLVEPVDLKIC
jgi:putative aminopeptidase